MARSRYQTIQEMYLEPVGISRQRFTWSKATAAGIAARNPSGVTADGFQLSLLLSLLIKTSNLQPLFYELLDLSAALSENDQETDR